MWDWFQRVLARQQDLAQGVDADLLQANRKKWRISWYLLGAGLLLWSIQSKIPRDGLLHDIVSALIMGCLLGWIVMLHWAWRERAFLDEPDPKEPLRLFPRR